MYDLLAAVEGTALAEALRGSGIWTYGLINLGHIIGLSLLFGAVVILDLRLLGLWRDTALATTTRLTVPLAGIGFVTAVVSGILMISFNATEYEGNLFLYVKLPVIVIALLNVLVVSRLPAWRARAQRALSDAEQRQLAVGGGVSLVCWVTVVACGRMIGYS